MYGNNIVAVFANFITPFQDDTARFCQSVREFYFYLTFNRKLEFYRCSFSYVFAIIYRICFI